MSHHLLLQFIVIVTVMAKNVKKNAKSGKTTAKAKPKANPRKANANNGTGADNVILIDSDSGGDAIVKIDDEKEKDYNSQKNIKIFKATIYSLRNGLSDKAPPGWVITDIEDIEWLGELFEQEVNISDL